MFPRPKSAVELRALLPEINPSWSSVWLPPRKGEDLEGIHARMSDFLKCLIHQIDTRSDMRHHKNILLLSHAAPIIAMCRYLLAQPELRLRVGCCTLSQFSRNHDATSGQETSRWEAVLLASSAHLTDQVSLRDWGFEDIVTDDFTGKVCPQPKSRRRLHNLSADRSSMTLEYQVQRGRKTTYSGHKYTPACYRF